MNLKKKEQVHKCALSALQCQPMRIKAFIKIIGETDFNRNAF